VLQQNSYWNLNSTNYSIYINRAVKYFDETEYLFKILDKHTQHFDFWLVSRQFIPTVGFSTNINNQVIMFFCKLFEEIFETPFKMYLSYPVSKQDKSIVVGSLLGFHENFSNVSKTFMSSDYIKSNPSSLRIIHDYPNSNPCDSGIVQSINSSEYGKTIYNETGILSSEEYFEDAEPEYESWDYGRETFDALTDGQLGDYDDFDGNIDDAKAQLGYD
jgi:hypothetical protein